VIAAVILGGDNSTFKETWADAVFPAMSFAVPETTLPSPLDDTVTAEGQTAIPDSASVHAKLTVTSVLFHPAPFGAGVALAVMFGGVLSMFTVAVAVAVLPLASFTVPETV
jgi:hypothetical protein